jgi:hypothetical protein
MARVVLVLKSESLLFAYKALTLVDRLSAADRRVAGALLGHYNSKTGQCDPGNARLARMLRMDERTVRRATFELCETHGLFSKVSHGGKSHRAFYTPNWDMFYEIVKGWDADMKRKDDPSDDEGNRAKPPGSLGRNGPVEQGETALQTSRRNSLNKLIAPYGASRDAGSGDDLRQKEPKQQSQPEGSNGLLRGSAGRDTARQMGKPKVVRSPSHETAARAQAERRLDADLRGLGVQAYAEALEHMDVEAATLAEIRRPGGGGLRQVMDQLGIRLLHGAALIGGKN